MATTENVHFRTTPELKGRMLEAAALLGLSLTDFVESAAAERAQQILRRETVVLTDEERDRFLAALDSPPDPTDKMKADAEWAMRVAREGFMVDRGTDNH